MGLHPLFMRSTVCYTAVLGLAIALGLQPARAMQPNQQPGSPGMAHRVIVSAGIATVGVAASVLQALVAGAGDSDDPDGNGGATVGDRQRQDREAFEAHVPDDDDDCRIVVEEETVARTQTTPELRLQARELCRGLFQARVARNTQAAARHWEQLQRQIIQNRCPVTARSALLETAHILQNNQHTEQGYIAARMLINLLDAVFMYLGLNADSISQMPRLPLERYPLDRSFGILMLFVEQEGLLEGKLNKEAWTLLTDAIEIYEDGPTAVHVSLLDWKRRLAQADRAVKLGNEQARIERAILKRILEKILTIDNSDIQAQVCKALELD
ncbi:MAG TPA: hypothetical protein PLV25_00090 [Opitutales bacterium]|nr:hypothetical protein [Opitutales bacterium]